MPMRAISGAAHTIEERADAVATSCRIVLIVCIIRIVRIVRIARQLGDWNLYIEKFEKIEMQWLNLS